MTDLSANRVHHSRQAMCVVILILMFGLVTGCSNDCSEEFSADGSTAVTESDLRRVAGNWHDKAIEELTCEDMCIVLKPGLPPNQLYTVVECSYVAFDDEANEEETAPTLIIRRGDEQAVGSLVCTATTRNHCSTLGD